MIDRIRLSIKLYQGDEYTRRITLTDDAGVPYDLSGYGAILEVRPKLRQDDKKAGPRSATNPAYLRLEKDNGITLDDQGNIDIRVTSEQAYNIPYGKYKYDLQLLDGDTQKTVLYGECRVIGEVSDVPAPYLEYQESYKGLPDGGTTGQHLTKKSDEPYDAEWTDVPHDGGDGTPGKDGEGVPEGGTAGQVLAKVDDTDFNTEWVDQADGGEIDDSLYAKLNEHNTFNRDRLQTIGRLDIDNWTGASTNFGIKGTNGYLFKNNALGNKVYYYGSVTHDDEITTKQYVDSEIAKVDVDLQPLIDRINELEARLDKCCPRDKHIFVTSREVTWDDLPARDQPDNGSLKLLSSEVRDGVPVVVETGKTFERLNPKTKELEQVPKTAIEYETRATYTYEADFEWNNGTGKSLTWLVDVLQFKYNKLETGSYAFSNMPAAQLTALPDLDTSNLTDMGSMFYNALAFNQPVEFDTSNVTSMGAMFASAQAFNQPLDYVEWTTSNVTSMIMMFMGATVFNQPLNFDTSNVTDVTFMFSEAIAFNQPLDFDTSNVTNRQYWFGMFKDAYDFDQDISHWCVEGIDRKPDWFDMNSGFQGQTAKQPQWGVAC